jgi:hypothetical protein
MINSDYKPEMEPHGKVLRKSGIRRTKDPAVEPLNFPKKAL